MGKRSSHRDWFLLELRPSSPCKRGQPRSDLHEINPPPANGLLASDSRAIRMAQVKLSGGRLVDGKIDAIIETTQGIRLQVSFGNETARIYLWQVVKKLR
jgi:hypothetical protein